MVHAPSDAGLPLAAPCSPLLFTLILKNKIDPRNNRNPAHISRGPFESREYCAVLVLEERLDDIMPAVFGYP